MDNSSNYRDIVPDTYNTTNLWAPSQYDTRHLWWSTISTRFHSSVAKEISRASYSVTGDWAVALNFKLVNPAELEPITNTPA